MIFLEALIVIGCIMLGARYSGIALGFAGILGELILVFGFGLKPAGAPKMSFLLSWRLRASQQHFNRPAGWILWSTQLKKFLERDLSKLLL